MRLCDYGKLLIDAYTFRYPSYPCCTLVRDSEYTFCHKSAAILKHERSYYLDISIDNFYQKGPSFRLTVEKSALDVPVILLDYIIYDDNIRKVIGDEFCYRMEIDEDLFYEQLYRLVARLRGVTQE